MFEVWVSISPILSHKLVTFHMSPLESDIVEITEASFKLDRSLLELEPEVETFFRSLTGITDVEDLKKHIFTITEEACKVY
jgi:hypothetical protein